MPANCLDNIYILHERVESCGRSEGKAGDSILFSVFLYCYCSALPRTGQPYLAVDWTHGPDHWLRAIGKDGLVVSVFPCQRLSVGQHGELVDDRRVQKLHVVRPRLDPTESVDDDHDDGFVSATHLSGQAPLLPAH